MVFHLNTRTNDVRATGGCCACPASNDTTHHPTPHPTLPHPYRWRPYVPSATLCGWSMHRWKTSWRTWSGFKPLNEGRRWTAWSRSSPPRRWQGWNWRQTETTSNRSWPPRCKPPRQRRIVGIAGRVCVKHRWSEQFFGARKRVGRPVL